MPRKASALAMFILTVFSHDGNELFSIATLQQDNWKPTVSDIKRDTR